MELRPCDKIRVIGYSKQSVEIVGKVSMTCTHATTIKKVNFYVTNLVDTKVILGLQFCRAFNLVSVNCDDNCICKEVAVEALNAEFPRGMDPAGSTMQNRPPPSPVDVNTKLRPDCKQHILELFPELFDGIGTMKDAEVILDVNPDVEPVVQPPHKIPQAMVEPLKCEIDRMLELGVIHKLDINKAFGLNQAQYFFQYYMDMNFCDINPTTNIITDDVMIHGNTDEEHDCNLIQVLNKCHEIGLKLNPDKCEFGKSEVTFYGNIVSDQGFKPDPHKVDAIVRMPAPTDKTELSSFLGMVNYLAPYIPKLSDCTAVLR